MTYYHDYNWQSGPLLLFEVRWSLVWRQPAETSHVIFKLDIVLNGLKTPKIGEVKAIRFYFKIRVLKVQILQKSWVGSIIYTSPPLHPYSCIVF